MSELESLFDPEDPELVPINPDDPRNSTAPTHVPGRHPGGRPRKWTLSRAVGLAKDLLTWMIEDKTRLTIELFFSEKGYRLSLFNDLCNRYPEFSEIAQEIKTLQQARIADGAVRGTLNGRFAQFWLMSRHGWRLPVQEVSQKTDLQVQAKGLSINFVTQAPDAGHTSNA